MRKIGSLDDKEQLSICQNYLYYHGIKTFNYDDASDCDLWVINDKDQQTAKHLLMEFKTNSTNLKFLEQASQGEKKYRDDQAQEKIKQDKEQVIDARLDLFKRSQAYQTPITLGIIILCCSLFLLQLVDKNHTLRQLLWISQDFMGNRLGIKSFYEIQHGQVWRLVTPILLHGDFLHLAFNMYWLYQLGTKVERHEGRFVYVVLVIVTAILSNVAYYLAAGPNFEGMSGVVYGIVGYMWAMAYMNPMLSYRLEPSLVRFFLIWYVLCLVLTMFGFGIANTVHGVGALTGILVGLVQTYRSNKNIRWSGYLGQESFYMVAILVALILGGVYTDHLLYYR